MSQVGQWMQVRVRSGTRDEVVKLMELPVEKAQEEPGTQLFVVHASDADPDLLLLYELYRDADAMAAHASGDWLPDYIGRLMPYLADEPVMHAVRPVLAKGL